MIRYDFKKKNMKTTRSDMFFILSSIEKKNYRFSLFYWYGYKYCYRGRCLLLSFLQCIRGLVEKYKKEKIIFLLKKNKNGGG